MPPSLVPPPEITRRRSWRRWLSPSGNMFHSLSGVTLYNVEDGVHISTPRGEVLALSQEDAMELSYALQAFAKSQGMPSPTQPEPK